MSTTTNDSSDTMPQLADKELYSDLTEKQQDVVDEYVKDPTAQNTVLAKRADVSRSTVYNVKEKYGHIIEQQMDRKGRYRGEETAEGDPFPELAKKAKGAQTILNRPHQPDDESDGGDEIQQEATDARLTVEFDAQAVRAVLTRECDERVRACVVEALWKQAFVNDDD